jgi:hypothetical protein
MRRAHSMKGREKPGALGYRYNRKALVRPELSTASNWCDLPLPQIAGIAPLIAGRQPWSQRRGCALGWGMVGWGLFRFFGEILGQIALVLCSLRPDVVDNRRLLQRGWQGVGRGCQSQQNQWLKAERPYDFGPVA